MSDALQNNCLYRFLLNGEILYLLAFPPIQSEEAEIIDLMELMEQVIAFHMKV